MALTDHMTLAVLIDGVVQAKITNVSVNGESGAQEVRTILEGLAGKTTGSRRLEVSGTWVIPIGGLEFNLVDAAANGTYHEVQIPVGAKSLISQGWFQGFGLSQSTDSASEATGTFVGELNPLQ